VSHEKGKKMQHEYGFMRHFAPVRTIQRNPLSTSRKSFSRCGASSVIKVKYGADIRSIRHH
jgi:hypothetical protein